MISHVLFYGSFALIKGSCCLGFWPTFYFHAPTLIFVQMLIEHFQPKAYIYSEMLKCITRLLCWSKTFILTAIYTVPTIPLILIKLFYITCKHFLKAWHSLMRLWGGFLLSWLVISYSWHIWSLKTRESWNRSWCCSGWLVREKQFVSFISLENQSWWVNCWKNSFLRGSNFS
jgi:hypothetical protein